jgi:tRNA(His) guanylyltransferase
MSDLKTRQELYESSYDHRIIPNIPVIIKLDIRGFSRISKSLDKPYCKKISDILVDTMVSLYSQVDNVSLGYQYSDKIILFIKPSDEIWYANKIQKMCSVSASLATYYFMTHYLEKDNSPVIEGVVSFASHVFVVPSATEAVNYLLYKQSHCEQVFINDVIYSILWNKYGKNTAEFLNGKSIEERKELLEEVGVKWKDLPNEYKLGTSCYMTPSIGSSGNVRKSMFVDSGMVVSEMFQDLKTIISTGSDIFRPER